MPSNNGYRSEEHGLYSITQVGNAVTLKSPGCTFNGTYSATGQVGRIDASYTCTSGAPGTVSFYDVRAEVSGIVGRYCGHGSNCDFDGDIGLGRRK